MYLFQSRGQLYANDHVDPYSNLRISSHICHLLFWGLNHWKTSVFKIIYLMQQNLIEMFPSIIYILIINIHKLQLTFLNETLIITANIIDSQIWKEKTLLDLQRHSVCLCIKRGPFITSSGAGGASFYHINVYII